MEWNENKFQTLQPIAMPHLDDTLIDDKNISDLEESEDNRKKTNEKIVLFREESWKVDIQGLEKSLKSQKYVLKTGNRPQVGRQE